MTTIAAIDIGTNSVKMTVGDRSQVLLDTVRITRLGEGVDEAGRLAEPAVARTLAALEAFGSTAREYGASRIVAVGTSALRDAVDREAFVAAARAALGGEVEVISGDREAHLVYLAARRDPDLALPADAFTAVTDVGGGSSEVAVGDAAQLVFQTSLQLGAVRLSERHVPLADAQAMVDAALAELPLPAGVAGLVASGGTATNLAGVTLGRRERDEVHGLRLERATLAALVARLDAMTLDERRALPGLDPARADIIVAGALIQWRLLERFGLDALIVSARGLRYGLLYALRDDA